MVEGVVVAMDEVVGEAMVAVLTLVVVVGVTVVVTLVMVVELLCFLLKTALYVKCV